MVAAVARPQWGEVPAEETIQTRDLVIALDVSDSMLCPDLPPSRRHGLLRGKELVLDHRGVGHVLGFAPVPVNGILVEREDASRRHVAPGLEPAAVPADHSPAVGPVGAEELGVVDKPDLAEHVGVFRRLFGVR